MQNFALTVCSGERLLCEVHVRLYAGGSHLKIVTSWICKFETQKHRKVTERSPVFMDVAHIIMHCVIALPWLDLGFVLAWYWLYMCFAFALRDQLVEARGQLIGPSTLAAA